MMTIAKWHGRYYIAFSSIHPIEIQENHIEMANKRSVFNVLIDNVSHDYPFHLIDCFHFKLKNFNGNFAHISNRLTVGNGVKNEQKSI